MLRKVGFASVSVCLMAFLVAVQFAYGQTQSSLTRHMRDVVQDGRARLAGRLSPTEALCLLMGGGLSAHDAADRLNTGMRTKKCRLWCDGNELPVAYIVTSLVVVARTEADGRWRADVVSSTREAWEHPLDYYCFEFDAGQVKALRQQPASDRRTDDKPRRQPGPVPEMKWRTVVAREVIRRARAGKPMPQAPEMLQYCQQELDWEPGLRTMQEYLRDLLP